MSVTRSTLVGGPAHGNYNSANVHFTDDAELRIEPVWKALEAQMFGETDRNQTDQVIVIEGTPLTYENLATWFPYISPTIGLRIPSGSDVAFKYLSNNNDRYTVHNTVVTEMPDLTLGVEGAILGKMKLVGLIRDGYDPSDANSYYTIDSTAYVAAAVDKSKTRRQEYSAAWGTRTGFSAFQAQEDWKIRHQLKLEPVKVQGRTRAFKVASYAALVSCMPVGPTAAQIDAQLRAQGTGATAGHRAGADVDDLVITGTSVSVTAKNAAMVSAGFKFGAVVLRNGEVGWVTTVDTSAGTWSGGLVMS